MTTLKQQYIQLKGAMVAMTVVELFQTDLPMIRQELEAKVSQAPDFFKDLPIIIALEKYQGNDMIPFADLIDIFTRLNMKPVAVRGGSDHFRTDAQVAGLALLPAQKERTESSAIDENKEPVASQEEQSAPPEPEPPTVDQRAEEPTQETAPKAIEHTSPSATANRLITQPVRSGQQIYAPGGDLIILAPVSAGAEILADGNIHVYGRLRGRALAGVKGNENARIFCQSLEAELVSIAGQYKISEDLQKGAWGQNVQISLNNGKLMVDPFTNSQN